MSEPVEVQQDAKEVNNQEANDNPGANNNGESNVEDVVINTDPEEKEDGKPTKAEKKSPPKTDNQNNKEDNDNNGDVFGPINIADLFFRTQVIAVAIILYCILGCTHWAKAAENYKDETNGCKAEDNCEDGEAGAVFYVLSYIIILIAMLISMFASLKGESKLGLVSLISVGVGALFWIIGYSLYWNSTLDIAGANKDAQEALASVYFAVDVITFVTAGAVAWDNYKVGFLNCSKMRAMFMSTVLFITMGFIAAVSSAVAAGEWKDRNDAAGSDDYYPEEGWGCVSAGFWIVWFAAVVRALMVYQVHEILENKFIKVVVPFLMAAGGLILAAGYWALPDSDYYDAGDDEQGVYFAGAGLFFIIVTWSNTLDMGIVKNIKALL